MKLLLYCTKAKPDLVDERRIKKEMPDNLFIGAIDDFTVYPTNERGSCGYTLNGKIVAECDYEVEEIRLTSSLLLDEDYVTDTFREKELLKRSCLSYHKLFEYLKNRENPRGYAIHIKNLHIFDKPQELYDYGMDFPISPIVKAPQNMMYANGINGRYILISIKPEWLCKILNGEKTIEVRKKVLKEMLR